MERYLQYFMWGYQEHFARQLAHASEAVLEDIGLGKVSTRGLVVGVVSPGRTNTNAVCVSPEDGIDIRPWLGLPALVSQVVKDHPMQQMHYGDAPSMNDKPEHILRDSVRHAVLQVVAPIAAVDGFTAFVGLAAPVGDYHVAPVVLVDGAALTGDHVLPTKVSFERWTAQPSFAHAAIDVVLSEATAELKRTDPGRYFGTRGLERTEIVRRAAAEFMHAPCLAVGDITGASGFFSIVNELSSLLYEQKHGRGVLALAHPGDPSVTLDLEFLRPVRLHNARWSRKLLEMGNAELALIADASSVRGLGRRVAPIEDVPTVHFDIEFLGQHRWWMKANGVPVIRSDFGASSVPHRYLDRDAFIGNFRRVFAGATAPEAERAADLFDAVEQLGHGCMIVFAEDAEPESHRLAGQGTPTTVRPMTVAVLERVSGIDGTILLDPESRCHAVGVILDGPAHPDCDPARGSRYNSAIRYVRAGMSGRLAIVGSDDGMIDVIPLLRPLVSRRRIREMVEALEASTGDNYHQARMWLMDHRFYLDGEMCRRVNVALERVGREAFESGAVRILDQALVPHSDLDDSYFLEDDG